MPINNSNKLRKLRPLRTNWLNRIIKIISMVDKVQLELGHKIMTISMLRVIKITSTITITSITMESLVWVHCSISMYDLARKILCQ